VSRAGRADVAPAPAVVHLPGIEGLRAVAATSILVYHAWLYAAPDGRPPHLLPGFFAHLPVGVTLFFALSGFLLYRPFAASMVDRTAMPGIRGYLRNRALRILPAYWFILVATALVLQTALLRSDALHLHPGRMSDPLLLARNAALVQGYSPRTILTGIGPAWSLAIEVVFYLVLPALAVAAVLLARRVERHRALVALLPAAALLVTGLVGKAVAGQVVRGGGPGSGWYGNWHSVLERGFLVQADLFAFGMGLAVLHTVMSSHEWRLPRQCALGLGAAAAAIGVGAALMLNRGSISQYPYDDLMAVACALLLAVVVLPFDGERPLALVARLSGRVPVAAGLASYSLFLWHEPVVHWAREHDLTAAGSGGFLVNLFLVAVVAGVLSALTYRFVERPALRRKRRVPSPA
jgi:peptidoglycan/LPS O-acetylase OafA/YrhL